MISKKILLTEDYELDKQCRRLAGLLRINSDLLAINEMITRSLQASNLFLDYAGIVITYRKCFKCDARKASLREKRHLKGMTSEQKEIHDHLICIGDKLVAHPEINEYDQIDLNLILDSKGKAISIEPYQTIFEPMGKKDLELLREIVNLAQNNLGLEVGELANSIIDRYNNGAKITFCAFPPKSSTCPP